MHVKLDSRCRHKSAFEGLYSVNIEINSHVVKDLWEVLASVKHCSTLPQEYHEQSHADRYRESALGYRKGYEWLHSYQSTFCARRKPPDTSNAWVAL